MSRNSGDDASLHSGIGDLTSHLSTQPMQVMRSVVAPLPDPETVPIEPTRLLRETAAKKGCTVRFLEVKEEDHSFTVHVFINHYLLVRCKLTS